LAKAQRKHKVALDAHEAKRAEVMERVKRQQPNLDDQEVWRAVSQDAGERATWKRRQQRRRMVAQTHERARRKREDFSHRQHQHSRRIVNEFAVIAVEDLSVASMVQKVQNVWNVQNGRLAKSIHDAAWSQLRRLIAWKAAWANRRYIAVNPAHTSQDCLAAVTAMGISRWLIGCTGASPVAWSSTENSTRVETCWQWGATAWAVRPRSQYVYTGGVVTAR